MSWPKPNLKNSLLALLGQAELTTAKRETRTEAIREFMLTELGAFGEEHYPKIMRRVRYATDVQDLWYARGDVMAVLSARDEVVGRSQTPVLVRVGFSRTFESEPHYIALAAMMREHKQAICGLDVLGIVTGADKEPMPAACARSSCRCVVTSPT